MGIRGKTPYGVAALGVIATLALAGCAPGEPAGAGASASSVPSAAASSAAPSAASSASAPSADPEPSAAAEPGPLDGVAGTYRNGDWVIRLNADGTWEEDLGGQANAYGGTFTVDGDRILLQDRGGSSEAATLSGDELQLPSVTLRRE